jgi:LytS/YehU family sensor histidine kinase
MMIEIPSPLRVKSEGWVVLIVIWLVELVIVSLVLVNQSFRQTLKLYRETAILQESTTKAQYVALQNQLNPHFLFNSLNVLISEIEYNPQSAIEFTRNLSDVYRYILQCQDQRLALLGDELEFLNSYIFLHQIRLGNCLILENNLDKDLYDRKVPPLTLQLLAENVIKHNFISISKPIRIQVSYSPHDDMLVVSNELRPKKDEPQSGKGLQNLSSRYLLVCNRTIVVQKDESHFTVKTPLLYD